MKKALFVLLALILVLAISCSPEHEHKYEEKTVPATCTKDGKTSMVCSCGVEKDVVKIPAKGHGELEYVVAEEPTEEKTGSYNLVCPICKEVVKTETIDKLLPNEIFVPYGTDTRSLTEGDDDFSFMKDFFEGNNELIPASTKEIDRGYYKDAVFIEGVVIGEEKNFEGIVVNPGWKVKDGKVTSSFLVKDGKSTITLDGNMNQIVVIGEQEHNIALTFKDATLTATLSEEDEWIGHQFASDESWSCVVNPESESISVTPKSVFDFCATIIDVVDPDEAFSSYCAESIQEEIALDEDGAVIYGSTMWGFVDTYTEEMNIAEIFTGKIKIGEKTQDVSFFISINPEDYSASFKYLKVGDVFYKTDALEKALNAE